jgi:hypothetical protein
MLPYVHWAGDPVVKQIIYTLYKFGLHSNPVPRPEIIDQVEAMGFYPGARGIRYDPTGKFIIDTTAQFAAEDARLECIRVANLEKLEAEWQLYQYNNTVKKAEALGYERPIKHYPAQDVKHRVSHTTEVLTEVSSPSPNLALDSLKRELDFLKTHGVEPLHRFDYFDYKRYIKAFGRNASMVPKNVQSAYRTSDIFILD